MGRYKKTSKAQAIRGVPEQELLNLKQEVTMAKKKQVGVRYDNNRTRLKTGETQRPNGTYAYRWSTPDGKRHSIYAPTLERLREQEEQIIVDKHDGIRSDVKNITVNEMFDLWCQQKSLICGKSTTPLLTARF